MWFQRLMGQSGARQDPRWSQLESAMYAAARGNRSALSQVSSLVVDLRSDLAGRALDSDLWTLVGSAVALVCDDDILNAQEEADLIGACKALGLHIKDLRTLNFAAWEQLAVARINDSRPPTLADPPMIVKAGEVAYAAFQVGLLKEVVRREWRGRSSGLSVPLGMGVRYRFGGSRGKSVVVGQDLVVSDSGALVITSDRAVFLGGQKTLEFRRDKLLGLQQYTDGLRLNVSNRQAPSLFRFGKNESPTVAAALVATN